MLQLLAASNAPTAELLTPLLWIFGVATLFVALLHLRRIPSLLGFLATGVILGPAGFGVVQDADTITILAEIGVVMLMFTIGLEVSLKDLARMATLVLGGGLMQIALTALAFTGLAFWAGLGTFAAISIGLIVSASSTALVLRILGDAGELGTPYGRLSLAILLAQDFAVVALILVLPMLAEGDLSFGTLTLGVLETIAVTAGIYLGARFFFPWALNKVVELRSREVFLMATMAVLFGTAMIADSLGLSLALGAFVAGLVVSESEFSHQMFAEILPFRDVFNGLFFASVGLLIDPQAVAENAGLLAAFIVAAIFVKGAIVWLTARAMRLDFSSAVIAGVAMAQVGEFGLVLAQQAAVLDLITATHYSLVIATAVATMALTPLVLPWVRQRMQRRRTPSDSPQVESRLQDHVIVVGYGLNGRNVARALSHLQVPLVVVELNQTTVVDTKSADIEVVYGDATRPALLHHLHVEKARALVSAIADASATRDIVSNARHANPELLIVARTRYVSEIEPLRELGADVVVPEEYETSIELVGRVLKAYGASDDAVQREKRVLRSERYKMLLEDPDDGDTAEVGELLYGLDVARLEVDPDGPLAGATLAELDLRAKTGATVVAILRGNETIGAPDANSPLQSGDVLVIVGDAESLDYTRALAKPTA